VSEAPLQHVAFFLQQLRGGGVPRMTLNLAAELTRRGHRVTLLVAISGGARAGDVAPGVEVVALDQGAVLRRLPRIGGRKWRVVLATAGLAGFLRRARPDALVAADHWANFVSVLARGLARARMPLMLTQRVPLSVRAAQQRLIGRLARGLYPRANAIVGVSEGLAQDLREQLPAAHDRISSIYNPVVTPDFPERLRAAPTHPWLRDGGSPVLVSLGRLTAQKDYPTLLRALATLRKERDVRLVIFGSGPDGDSLEALAGELGIAEAVDLPGYVRDTLPELAHAAAFVLSSRFEGFGNVLVEALASGCPIVSTDCPSGPSEILDGGRFGTLVPVGDADALTAALAAVLDAPLERAVLRRRAELFTVERATDAYLHTLRGGTA
jgi:glycosyltransferase involved in cell wall biosynthesis